MMRRIDELFTGWSFLGSRRTTVMLKAEALQVNRKRVQRSIRQGRSAGRPSVGKGSTYRHGKSAQTTRTTSLGLASLLLTFGSLAGRSQVEIRMFELSKIKVLALPFAAMIELFPASAKAPIWSSSDQYGNFSLNGYSWNNDVYGQGAGPQTISVHSVNQWSVWSNQPDTGGIKSYPHEAFNVGKPLSAINNLSSSFNQSVPTSGSWNFAYDIWDSSNAYEIMLWTNYTGNPDGSGDVKPISYKYNSSGTAAIPVYTSVNVGGATWNVFEGWNKHKVISFLRTSKTNSETVDIKSILQWIKSKGYFGDIAVGSVQYGVEITSSPGGQSFDVNHWSVISK
ncbi:IS3 family transposase [Bradyrhizobium sp. DOA1]|uniref:glycoside hydrolase family 12 protein n=1 Tax=Bradyrhizobium sp. DOA1 TaxID=1126616 RepID=UPI0024C07CE2|nr:IS3 family transposase [Bradyrhizobium sp. DOA1]